MIYLLHLLLLVVWDCDKSKGSKPTGPTNKTVESENKDEIVEDKDQGDDGEGETSNGEIDEDQPSTPVRENEIPKEEDGEILAANAEKTEMNEGKDDNFEVMSNKLENQNSVKEVDLVSFLKCGSHEQNIEDLNENIRKGKVFSITAVESIKMSFNKSSSSLVDYIKIEMKTKESHPLIYRRDTTLLKNDFNDSFSASFLSYGKTVTYDVKISIKGEDSERKIGEITIFPKPKTKPLRR